MQALKYLDEYRRADLALKIADDIKRASSRPFNIMEVCGGHTMSIRKSGIHKIIGENINLISGPGCPVCVTPARDIEKAIALSRLDGTVICTFGDLVRVPGASSSLEREKAAGSDIRMVYSAYDALRFAGEERRKDIIFISIGFETTAPTAAAAIMQARNEGLENFSVLSLNKTMPEALRAVLGREDSNIDALICPGHVSTITGTGIYRFIVEEIGIPCCVAGFEPVDILEAIRVLTDLLENGEKKLVNAYQRAVRKNGNMKAKAIMAEVFRACDSEWRGFGVIPASGLEITEEYGRFDAEKKFDINVPVYTDNSGCICGDILRGSKRPADCGLFGSVCTPEDPKGACMVSSEGTCAAWYKYRRS